MVRGKTEGFTLIEMMVTIGVIALLAMVALPAYQDYIRKARRADGMDSLLHIQNLQEKWRANHTTYGTLANIGLTSSSLESYYTLSITNASATGYVAQADPVGDQANDDQYGTSCDPLTITVDAGHPRGSKTPVDCW